MEIPPLKPIPQRIIRFYGKTEYALQCITQNKVTFVRSTQLNDPFDPWLGFVTDFNDDYSELIRYIKNHHPDDINKFRSRVSPLSLVGAIKNVRARADELIGKLFILSTCEVSSESNPQENLYMWSHYGNGHRGIAIEFDGPLLNKKFRNKGITDNVLWDIYYSDDTPKISCHDVYQFSVHQNEKHFAKKIDASVRIKSDFWKTECEWRLVETSETSEKIVSRELPEAAITKIYLGCQIEEAIKQEAIKQARHLHPKVEIYLAHKLPDKFGLSFEKI